MQNQNSIVDHALAALSDAIGHTGETGCQLLEHRHFSSLYELTPDGHEQSYVLKISTTDRSCVEEYEQYQFINSLRIPSLKPTLCSETHNYLITEKLALTDITEHLKHTASDADIETLFGRFGSFLKLIVDALPEDKRVAFSADEYWKYIAPRIHQLESISQSERSNLSATVQRMLKNVDVTQDASTITSDFSLSNIHLDEDRNFVFVDMGDAEIGSIYDSIAFIYLELWFGGSHKYLTSKNKANRRFNAFLRGLDRQQLNDELFKLFQIKRLVLMIHFTERYRPITSSPPRRILTHISNRLLVGRFSRHLNSLLD